MTALPIVAAAVVGGLAAIERKAFAQAQLSRPIVLGPLLGWILGDPLGGLAVGAPLELIWIGTANLGAVLPHHETSASAAIVVAAVAAGTQGSGVDGSLACLAFALFAPAATLARSFERRTERAGERRSLQAEVWLGQGRPERALRLHLANLWRPFVAMAVLVAVAAAVGGPLLSWISKALPARVQLGLSIGWLLFWAAGGALAVRAVRLPNGLRLAASGAVFALALGALIHGGGR